MNFKELEKAMLEKLPVKYDDFRCPVSNAIVKKLYCEVINGKLQWTAELQDKSNSIYKVTPMYIEMNIKKCYSSRQ